MGEWERGQGVGNGKQRERHTEIRREWERGREAQGMREIGTRSSEAWTIRAGGKRVGKQQFKCMIES